MINNAVEGKRKEDKGINKSDDGKTETHQEVGGRRHGDPVMEEFTGVVVHRTARLHRLHG